MNPCPSTVEYHPQEISNLLNNSTKKNEEKENIQTPLKYVPYSNQIPSVSTTNSSEITIKNDQEINKKLLYKTKRIFKVIIIGDAGVGKTCLSFRFCNGRFPEQTEATIGVDFRERSLIIDGELLRIQLWDTAGQERYRQSIVTHYYRNVNAVVFVYDVTNYFSFKSLKSWINECQKHSIAVSDEIPHILIGNKCDVKSSTSVKTDEAQIFADANDMALFETSALSNSEADHVESIFMTLVHKLRHSKAMHVQTTAERQKKDEKLILKANEIDSNFENNNEWCC